MTRADEASPTGNDRTAAISNASDSLLRDTVPPFLTVTHGNELIWGTRTIIGQKTPPVNTPFSNSQYGGMV
jgi:hypothetical protein